MLALVLPYVDLPSLPLPFGLSIHPFGVLAALGAYLGARLALHAARVYAPGDTRVLAGVFTWTIVGGVLGAHLLHVLGYHPELLRTFEKLGVPMHERELLAGIAVDGVSSMGGVLGGLAGIFLYFRAHAQPVRPYLDALALGAAPGWAVARIGCAVVHDHPGIRSDAWVAALLLHGAVLGALANVRINLPGVSAPELSRGFGEDADNLERRATEALEETHALAKARRLTL